jgi:hypothetical protein
MGYSLPHCGLLPSVSLLAAHTLPLTGLLTIHNSLHVLPTTKLVSFKTQRPQRHVTVSLPRLPSPQRILRYSDNLCGSVPRFFRPILDCVHRTRIL